MPESFTLVSTDTVPNQFPKVLIEPNFIVSL